MYTDRHRWLGALQTAGGASAPRRIAKRINRGALRPTGLRVHNPAPPTRKASRRGEACLAPTFRSQHALVAPGEENPLIDRIRCEATGRLRHYDRRPSPSGRALAGYSSAGKLPLIAARISMHCHAVKERGGGGIVKLLSS